jgi:hypothetical protein
MILHGARTEFYPVGDDDRGEVVNPVGMVIAPGASVRVSIPIRIEPPPNPATTTTE